MRASRCGRNKDRLEAVICGGRFDWASALGIDSGGPGDAVNELFRGKAEILVSVFKMQKGDQSEKIYTKELTSLYPLSAPRATSEISYDRFRRQYLGRLSEEVGRLFYEYFNGDDMADVI